MAFKKTLVQRLFNLSRFSTPNMSRNKPNLTRPEQTRPTLAIDPGENSPGLIPKRGNQRRPLYQSATTSPSMASPRLFRPSVENLSEKLRGLDIVRDRIRLDGLIPLRDHAHAPEAAREEDAPRDGVFSVSEVRKVLRASQGEAIRAKLREIEEDWIMYDEFVKICSECCGGNIEQGLSFAKSMDESSSVIVLGSLVCLRPSQEIRTLVANAIHNLIQPSMSDLNDPRRKELAELEEQKQDIDYKADILVRRELWAGLGYLVLQTAAFMRLTFWELSWDVMEPICFYVTSAYFMAGYAFFLRTSKEPSFEGFFQSRFSAKQNKLMKARNFDFERYIKLRKIFYPHYSSPSASKDDYSTMIQFDGHHKSD